MLTDISVLCEYVCNCCVSVVETFKIRQKKRRAKAEKKKKKIERNKKELKNARTDSEFFPHTLFTS